MRIIARRTLREFWLQHADAEEPLLAWCRDASRAEWKSPRDIKDIYVNASILSGDRVVFNIKGNSYRLVVAVRYDTGIIFVRFIGTHREYDRIDATTI
jgi:mRNA interferase HigB